MHLPPPPPPPLPTPMAFTRQGHLDPSHTPSPMWMPPTAPHASTPASFPSVPSTPNAPQRHISALAPFSTPVHHMPPYYHHTSPTPPLLWQPYPGWSPGHTHAYSAAAVRPRTPYYGHSQQPGTPTPATNRRAPAPAPPPSNFANNPYAYGQQWQPAITHVPGPSSGAYSPPMSPGVYPHSTSGAHSGGQDAIVPGFPAGHGQGNQT
ncbi:hypothetical protein C8Q73DRAFT_266653 [Cubamyces lactineus]|nr:hypothetical protein C8Q73DRAFT_266653 [Cubamyces lactineus]